MYSIKSLVYNTQKHRNTPCTKSARLSCALYRFSPKKRASARLSCAYIDFPPKSAPQLRLMSIFPLKSAPQLRFLYTLRLMSHKAIYFMCLLSHEYPVTLKNKPKTN
ncbi:hypothetical protein Hanom_Chr07g00674151 [Helianthus anomalus]